MQNTAITVWNNEMPGGIIEIPPNSLHTIWMICTKSADTRQTNIVIRKGAEMRLNGIIILRDKKCLSANLNIIHEEQNSVSRVNIRTVLFGCASIRLEHCAKIRRGASGANTCVTLRTLLAGDGARDISVPSMEIDEQAALAKHAASIGRIDDNGLFYLQSRGLMRAEAELTMIMGFVNELIHTAPSEVLDCVHTELSY